VGSQRETWKNPLGKVFSLAALGLAALFGVFAVISATAIIEWSEGPEQATFRLWGTVTLLVLVLACVGFAMLPTWSITAGPRGVGLKKLWRHTFVPHDKLRQVVVGGSEEEPTVKFVTDRGSVGVFPRIPKGDEIAKHVEMLKRRKS
jgi:hypothetical protein